MQVQTHDVAQLRLSTAGLLGGIFDNSIAMGVLTVYSEDEAMISSLKTRSTLLELSRGLYTHLDRSGGGGGDYQWRVADRHFHLITAPGVRSL